MLDAKAGRQKVSHMAKYSGVSLDLTFRALSDPTRRELVRQLAKGEWRVTDLASRFSSALPTISKHLVVLEQAGLAKRRRRGREHLLRLDARPMLEAADWIETNRVFWEGSLDNLARYLEGEPKSEK